jgi:pyridoxal phosphate enzyme (YggS family)
VYRQIVCDDGNRFGFSGNRSEISIYTRFIRRSRTAAGYTFETEKRPLYNRQQSSQLATEQIINCYYSFTGWLIVSSEFLVYLKIMDAMEKRLSGNLAAVQMRIEQAARKAGRNASDVKLVAVSKTHPTETLRKAIRTGALAFGENKVQEAEGKIEKLGRDSVKWHLIGHLQANKARKAVKLFDVIHTLDSIELAARLDRICIEEERPELSVLVQVDLGNEPTKSGVREKDLPELIEFLQNCECLKLTGLMILPPYFEDAEKVRPYFQKLRAIRDALVPNGELSMGMSHDYEIAIEEGATLVRVGTAIFGQREYAGK